MNSIWKFWKVKTDAAAEENGTIPGQTRSEVNSSPSNSEGTKPPQDTTSTIVPYRFENMDKGKRARLGDEKSTDQVKILTQRLILKPDSFAKDELIKQYIISNHRAVEWYLDEICSIRKSQECYFWGTLGLLVVVPIIVFFAPQMFDKTDATMVIGQMTALLTAIYGVHRAISTWMEKRAGASHFWEASAKLKSNIYDLEEKWRGRAAKDGKLVEGFRSDLLLGIHEARRIIAEEQSTFFKLQTFTKIDLGATLRSEAGGATALTASLENPIVQRQIAAQKAADAEEKEIRTQRQRLSELEGQVEGLQKIIDRRKEELGRTTEEKEKASLRKEIQELRSAKSKAETDHMKTQSALISRLG